jgi:hypothetical protein
MAGSGYCLKTCTNGTTCRTPYYDCFDVDGDGSTECAPLGSGSGAVGAPCARDADCAGGQLGFCYVEPYFKGGYCTLGCDTSNPCPGGSVCGTDGICYKTCSMPSDCRSDGYMCGNTGAGNGCIGAGTGTAAIGDACVNYWDCAGADVAACIGFTGGYCSQVCGTSLPACPAGTTCIMNIFGTTSLCLKNCTVATQCRQAEAYTCKMPQGATSLECAP